MYSKETIKNVITKLNTAIHSYDHTDVKNIKLAISHGNKKIGKVMNVSIAPIITCGNHCKECKCFCYDIKAVNMYPSCLDARARNTAILLKDREEYFNRIENAINRRKKNKFFRWHVAGEIIDINYFSHMVEIAKRHPDFIFWTYTKNYTVVNAYCDQFGRENIPNNFHIMFSKWDGKPLVNPYNFPVFACKLKNGNKDNDFDFSKAMKCPGNCDICKEHKIGCIGGMNTYAIEH